MPAAIAAAVALLGKTASIRQIVHQKPKTYRLSGMNRRT
jgi:hypothetical protein